MGAKRRTSLLGTGYAYRYHEGERRTVYSFIPMTLRICDVKHVGTLSGKGGKRLRNGDVSMIAEDGKLPSLRVREIDPSSGMLSFRLCDFMNDIADSYSMLTNFMALSVVSFGNSFIMSTSVFRSFPLRSTGTRN